MSGGGCKPVPEPMPASPRLIAGLSNSASAGPIGWTSGRCALDLGDLPGFFGVFGVFAMAGIWDESVSEERANGVLIRVRAMLLTAGCQQSRAALAEGGCIEDAWARLRALTGTEACGKSKGSRRFCSQPARESPSRMT